MLRTVVLSLILFASLSTASLLGKSIARRQSEPEFCQAIQGFDCKCAYYRITCTSDRELPQSLTILPNEKQKYQSVELVINGEHVQTVHDTTFEPVKELYKPEADNLEFRVKFEKFTELHLSSPSIFNRVFPDNVPSSVRKAMALEIYNPLIQPKDNVHLFANLNVDSLELYTFYPFHGTFQQLFSGANIKYLRLSGDIRSDLSQPFTGNVGRLELAKQASQLSVQNFPAFPAHELIINAFYVTDFTTDHPPNYSNLVELRIYSQEGIPANAFRQFPNLNALSVATEKEIDPHAFDGLYNLEKLTIKDTKASLDVLNKLPNVREFETNIDKLSEREQCDLAEKLANGQVAVQSIPNGYTCSCVLAYVDTASGRYPCNAENCEQSACPSVRDNFDATTRTFKTPAPIKRLDGSDALRPREAKVYSAPYQVSQQDQEKYQRGSLQHTSEHDGEGHHESGDPSGKDAQTHPHPSTSGSQDQYGDDDGSPSDQQSGPLASSEKPDQDGGDGAAEGENQQDGDGSKDGGAENQAGEGGQENTSQPESAQSPEGSGTDGAATVAPAKKGFSWLPIIIIGAAIFALLLIGLIILIIRKRSSGRGYNQAATSEHAASTTARA